MKGETRRYRGRHGTDTMTRREIGGNTYCVHVAPIDHTWYSHHVTVYADKINGDDLGFPDPGHMFKNKYKIIVDEKVKKDEQLAPAVSKIVNEAVGELTNRLEETKSQEDAVLGALDANETVHEE